MKKLILAFAFLAFLVNDTFASAGLPIEDSQAVELSSNQEPLGVFIHITAAQAGPDGVRIGTITKITLAENTQPGKGKLRARLSLEGNKLKVQVRRKGGKDARLVMPKGFIISEDLGQRLGATKSVVMSGGSTMLKGGGTSLLHFEIQ